MSPVLTESDFSHPSFLGVEFHSWPLRSRLGACKIIDHQWSPNSHYYYCEDGIYVNLFKNSGGNIINNFIMYIDIGDEDYFNVGYTGKLPFRLSSEANINDVCTRLGKPVASFEKVVDSLIGYEHASISYNYSHDRFVNFSYEDSGAVVSVCIGLRYQKES